MPPLSNVYVTFFDIDGDPHTITQNEHTAGEDGSNTIGRLSYSGTPLRDQTTALRDKTTALRDKTTTTLG